MRVIITGGTGLIGRALVADLVSAGHAVVILSRSPDRATGLPEGVRVERWDALTAHAWGPLAEGAHAIVNLAGENIGAGLWTAKRKRRIRDSRLNAGRAVLQAVELASDKPRVLIQASGVGYYGASGDEEITEEAHPGDSFLARLGREWEAVTEPVEALGVRRVIIRTGPVLSRAGGAFPLLALRFRLFAGGPLGDGRHWFPWIHVADQVAAMRFLIETEAARGPFNLTAPNPLTDADFGRLLGRVMRRPYFVPAPAFALRLLLGQLATALLDGQRAIPRRLLDLGFTFRFPHAEAAVEDLLKRDRSVPR